VSLNGFLVWELNYRPHLPDDRAAPILDIGCGTGEFLAYLEQNGYRCLRGVEIDATRAQASRRRTHAVIDEAGDLEAYLRTLPDRFALVTLKSVISHFPRDRAETYLRAMGDVLAPGGRLVVETFNLSRWTGPYMLFNDITHHWAYTEYSLRQILEAAGLSVIELKGERMPRVGLKGRLFGAVQASWKMALRLVYFAERGIGRNPSILGKYLVAVCAKQPVA
jgi:SAM-dependent methyltransferase